MTFLFLSSRMPWVTNKKYYILMFSRAFYCSIRLQNWKIHVIHPVEVSSMSTISVQFNDFKSLADYCIAVLRFEIKSRHNKGFLVLQSTACICHQTASLPSWCDTHFVLHIKVYHCCSVQCANVNSALARSRLICFCFLAAKFSSSNNQ